MAYRIRYGRGRSGWNVRRIQIALAVCLGIGVALAEPIGAEVGEGFPPKKAWVESYVAGEGFRRSMVAYCAAVLEQAGYDKEHIR